MIELAGVSKAYRTKSVVTHAMRDVSMTVDAGDYVAITGPSGSGKSTLLNVLGLLEPASEGTYRLDGVEVSSLGDAALAAARNRKIGFVFQSFNLLPDLNVYANVDVPLRYARLPRPERRERIEAALALVGLASRMRHYPSQLSGGQQQRVAIARAVAINPCVLLADEPTGNLDTTMSRQIIELLEALNGRGTTVVMVTHSQTLARRARRLIRVLDGRVREETAVLPAPAEARATVNGS